MVLYHATTTANLASIQADGLRVACAAPASKIKGCWMVSRSNRSWAVLHVQARHKVALEDVVVIEVSIPRSTLTRFRSGVWVAKADVPAAQLGVVMGGVVFGASVSD